MGGVAVVAALLASLLLFGCVAQDSAKNAEAGCIRMCKNAKQELSDGPCLSNEIAPGWVCDVAHSPREAVDNLPQNQCEAYRNGTAQHFVEVDANCALIRAI